MRRRDILLLGAGGHALACIDVLLLEDRYRIVGLLGRPEEVGLSVGGFPVIGDDSAMVALMPRIGCALVVLGQIKSPAARRRLYAEALAAGATLPVVVSPRAYVSPTARIGAGTIVMHGAIVNTGAEIGENCIINSRALIEHGARVGEHCHVSTGAILNGDARLGAGSFLGSGAVVRHGATIGEGAFVRMGELVKRDLPGS
jgi:sugar O-acyltransferase (sialic acid O-acetyltransferase NeuD family)